LTDLAWTEFPAARESFSGRIVTLAERTCRRKTIDGREDFRIIHVGSAVFLWRASAAFAQLIFQRQKKNLLLQPRKFLHRVHATRLLIFSSM
jgi:hypothetical protein